MVEKRLANILVSAILSGMAAAAVYALAGVVDYLLQKTPLESWFLLFLGWVALATICLCLLSAALGKLVHGFWGKRVPLWIVLLWGGLVGLASCLVVDQPESLPVGWLPYFVALSAGVLAATTYLRSRSFSVLGGS